jgi:hypothetical protein
MPPEEELLRPIDLSESPVEEARAPDFIAVNTTLLSDLTLETAALGKASPEREVLLELSLIGEELQVM